MVRPESADDRPNPGPAAAAGAGVTVRHASGTGGTALGEPPSRVTAPVRAAVPVRTIAATIAMVLATVALLFLLGKVTRILTWCVIAAFLAVICNPAVDLLHRRLRLRRALATLVVFILGLALFAGMMFAFIRPLVREGSKFADDFPSYVDKAKRGEGSVGKLVKRYKLADYVDRNQERWKAALSNAGKPAAQVARTVANTLAAAVTILVLSFLMVLEGPKVLDGIITMLPDAQRHRIRHVAADSSKAVTGYMGGNLLISVIAGAATWVWLLALHVPFAGVLALWVAFADLIPMVGATLGAVATVGVALLHSPSAGIATLIFYIVYQQFENHVLQVGIMSRTVRLNPLTVLVSVLLGVQLFGFLGALLAIPAAGIVQVIVRDLYDSRTGRLRLEPVLGAEEVPLHEAVAEEDGDERGGGHEEEVVYGHGVPVAGANGHAEGEAAPMPVGERHR